MSEPPASLSPAKQRLLQRLLEEEGARSADAQWGVADAYVAPLRIGGAKPPLFLIHPIMGVAFPYHMLVAALDPDRAVFGLQSFDNRGAAHPSWKMERIVESYVTEVRKIQPKGPYYLAGWSFGSMAAYEMACQLSDAGEEVRSLIVLDTWAPGSGSVLDYVRFGWSVCLDIWPFVGQYLRLRRAAADSGPERRTARPPDIFPLLRTYRRNSLAVMLYRPRKKFAGALHLLRSIKSPGVVLPEPDWGWKQFALGGVVVRTVVGNHMALLAPPQVGLVAAEMKRLLSE